MQNNFFGLGLSLLAFIALAAIAGCSTSSKEPQDAATVNNPEKSGLYVWEDQVSWQITRPQITWRLDQKVIDELKLSSVEVNQREQSLRNSLVKNLSAEAALTASLSASANAQATLSLNPLSMLAGNGADIRTAADMVLSGKLGASWSQTNTETNGSSHLDTQQTSVDLSFARAISEPRLQFTVTIRNKQPKDLICRNLNIPIWGADNMLAQAVPVDSDGQRLTEFTVPANRPDGIDQMFTAKISDTAFWEFIQGGGLVRGMELRLERGAGQILQGVNGPDLISMRASELSRCIQVTVELPTGANMTWWVAHRSNAVYVAQILTTINEFLRNRLSINKDAFCFEDGVLVSALGDDQYLSGYVWELYTRSGKMSPDDDLRTVNAIDGLLLRRRLSAIPGTLTFLRKAAKAGNGHAMFQIGEMYQDGHGIDQDYIEAMKWFRRAADLGDGGAMLWIGKMYQEGQGVTMDYIETVKWFRKSADAGNTYAMEYLGLMYRGGHGVEKDNAEAIKWFRKAAKLGDENAKLWLQYQNLSE